MNIIITPRSNKNNFYNNCNSKEMPFGDNDHHTFINSKYYNINELNVLNKANYFRILNIVSLTKNIDSVSKSKMKFNVSVIGLSKDKIRLNSFINIIFLCGYTFSYGESKSTHGDTSFYTNDKLSFGKQNISLDKNLESTFIEVNLPPKKNFIFGCIYKHPKMLIGDLSI